MKEEERKSGACCGRGGLSRLTDFCVSSWRHLLVALPRNSSSSSISQVALPNPPWILSSAPLFPASFTSGFPLFTTSLHTLSTTPAHILKKILVLLTKSTVTPRRPDVNHKDQSSLPPPPGVGVPEWRAEGQGGAVLFLRPQLILPKRSLPHLGALANPLSSLTLIPLPF